MPPDLVIQNITAGSSAKDYVLPNSLDLTLKCVTASFDGTSAASAFIGEVQIIDASGLVVARCPCSTTVGAGGSADISWFRLSSRTGSGSSESAYSQLVLSNPFIRVYYKQDETSGTTCIDSGPAGINATYLNSPTLGVPPLASGTAVVYNGAASQGALSGSTATFVATGPQSVVCWMKSTQSGASLPLMVASDDNNFRYLQLGMDTTGVTKYVVFDAGNANPAILTGSAVINDGNKHMIAATWDSSQVQTIYVDGNVDATQTTALVGQSTRIHAFELAKRDLVGNEHFYTGTLDEVSLYNGAITAADVSALYAAGVNA